MSKHGGELDSSFLKCNLFLSTGVELLKVYSKEMSKFEAERQDLANAEKLFDLSITMYTDLIQVQKELSSLDILFKLYTKQKVSFLNNILKKYGNFFNWI